MATIQEICSKPTSTSQISKKKEAIISSSGMSETEEENRRFKLVSKMKDYKSPKQCIEHDMITTADKNNVKEYASDREDGDLNVVLSLGRSSSILSEAKIKDQRKVINKGGELSDNLKEDHGLALCLNCTSAAYHHQITTGQLKNDESAGKSDQAEEISTDQTWPPSKDLRKSRTGEDDENHPKKARVSVRAICNAPTMNDGCQWRKYGQKIAKGNPCPRAYYRCTISPSCPVRKHVQRCPENMSILVTTYEGSHDHPLPPSATAMASTTSAAVSMLKSSSSISTSQPSFSLPSTTSNLHINKLKLVQPSFYLPNTTVSTSHIHPTVTLDLTAPTASYSYNKYASTFLPQSPAYNSPTNCLNFSAASSSSPSSFEYWNSLPNHNIFLSSYNDTQLLLPQSQTQIYQPYYKMATRKTDDQARQTLFSSDKIAAATREITSNPSFQSALAAAISSIVGKTGAQRMEPPSEFGFATSSLNRPSTIVPSNSQASAGNLKFEMPFASNKGPVAGSPAEKGQYNK